MEVVKNLASGIVSNLISLGCPYLCYKVCKRISKSHCHVKDNQIDFSLPTIRELEETNDDLLAELRSRLDKAQQAPKNV